MCVCKAKTCKTWESVITVIIFADSCSWQPLPKDLHIQNDLKVGMAVMPLLIWWEEKRPQVTVIMKNTCENSAHLHLYKWQDSFPLVMTLTATGTKMFCLCAKRETWIKQKAAWGLQCDSISNIKICSLQFENGTTTWHLTSPARQSHRLFDICTPIYTLFIILKDFWGLDLTHIFLTGLWLLFLLCCSFPALSRAGKQVLEVKFPFISDIVNVITGQKRTLHHQLWHICSSRSHHLIRF